MTSAHSEDELWLVHLREFHATGRGDLPQHLRAVLAGMLISDALRCGVGSVTAEITAEGWVLLACDQEWLQLKLPRPIPSRDLFAQLVFWPGDARRTRHERHVAVAASDVFIGRSGTYETIKGSLPSVATIDMVRKYPFVLGYILRRDNA